MIIPYFCLALSIAAELIGTTFLVYSEGFTKLKPSIITIISYSFCFFMLSKVMLYIHLSISYATWSAVGTVVSTLISVNIFKQKITKTGIAALAMLVVGVVILNIWG